MRELAEGDRWLIPPAGSCSTCGATIDLSTDEAAKLHAEWHTEVMQRLASLEQIVLAHLKGKQST